MDPLLIGVRNLIESIPASKFNHLVRESNLSCSYVHCVVNPMLNLPDRKRHAMWLNTQFIEQSNKQPDFIGSTIKASQLEGPRIIGEVKGEDRKDDIHPCLLDLIRIGVLSGESINQNIYDGVIDILAIGLHHTSHRHFSKYDCPAIPNDIWDALPHAPPGIHPIDNAISLLPHETKDYKRFWPTLLTLLWYVDILVNPSGYFPEDSAPGVLWRDHNRTKVPAATSDQLQDLQSANSRLLTS